VHCGGWRVDPPGGDEDQRGEGPKKQDADDKPTNKRSEEAGSMRRLGARV
jgi:hypothetical protein